MMKCIVAGGRDYQLTYKDRMFLSSLPITELVSGCASGADKGGEDWAEAMGTPIKRFPADWNQHGKAAGPIRNRDMARYADAVVLFPGGKGTASMRREAELAGIVIYKMEKQNGEI